MGRFAQAQATDRAGPTGLLSAGRGPTASMGKCEGSIKKQKIRPRPSNMYD